MKPTRLLPAGIAAILMASLTGCSMFDAKPAADSGFNPSTASTATRAAFLQKVWMDEAYRGQPLRTRFSSIYIAPVNISYLKSMDWWQQQNVRKDEIAADARALAVRMQETVKHELATYPGDHIPVASAPGPGVLTMELALVELVPSKAFFNSAATAAGFVVPGAGLLSAAGSGSIAIEGRLLNDSNAVIVMFKDRRTDKVAPVNLGNYTWYHGAEENIKDWAAECAEVLNSTNTVVRPSAITLKPW